MSEREFRPFSLCAHGCVEGEPPPESVRMITGALGALMVVGLIIFWVGVFLGWWRL